MIFFKSHYSSSRVWKVVLLLVTLYIVMDRMASKTKMAKKRREQRLSKSQVRIEIILALGISLSAGRATMA